MTPPNAAADKSRGRSRGFAWNGRASMSTPFQMRTAAIAANRSRSGTESP